MKKLNKTEIAKKFNVTPRTVGMWKRDGAPVHDMKKLAVWCASRRQPPRLAITSDSKAPKAKRDGTDDYTPGLQAAKRRAELEEVRSARALHEAQSNGDALQTRIAEDRWAKAQTRLVKISSLMRQSALDNDELVHRDRMLDLCHDFHDALWELRFVFQDIAPKLIGLSKLEECDRVLQSVSSTLVRSILTYFSRPRNAEREIPKWMIKGLSLGRGPVLPKDKTEDEVIEQQQKAWALLCDLAVSNAEEEREWIEKWKERRAAATATGGESV